MLHSRAGNRAARSGQARVGGEDRRSDRWYGRRGVSAQSRLKDLRGCLLIRDLLKTLDSILLKITVHSGQQITVKEDTEPGPEHPVGRGAVGQANSWSQVVRVLAEGRW